MTEADLVGQRHVCSMINEQFSDVVVTLTCGAV